MAVSVMLYTCSLVDVPRFTGFGRVTGLGALTLFYNSCTWILWGLTPAITGRVLTATFALGPYLLWGCVSLAWSPAIVSGVQNLAVISAFWGALLLCARESGRSREFRNKVQRAFTRATTLATFLYCLGLVMVRFGFTPILSARGFALFALLGMACFLGAWRYDSKLALLWAVLLTALIGFSLSRMAFAVALALYPLAQRPSRGLREVARIIVWVSLVVTVGYFSITYAEPLHMRFFSGDMSLDLGGIRLNASGRTGFWRAMVNSYMESWLLGKGAGSSEALMQRSFVDIGHPHNDYLRILHDYGLVGLVLWLSAMGMLFWHVVRAWLRADKLNSSEAALHLSAFLILVVVSLTMTSDNTLIYIFMMAPAGALVGMSLGARRPRSYDAQQNRGSRTSSPFHTIQASPPAAPERRSPRNARKAER